MKPRPTIYSLPGIRAFTLVIFGVAIFSLVGACRCGRNIRE